MTRLLLIVWIFLGLTVACEQDKSQKVDWLKMTSFRIYEHSDKGFDSYTDSDFVKLKFVEAGIDDPIFYLGSATNVGKKDFIYKGCYYCLVTFQNGQKRKLMVSTYGGFFTDLTDNNCYEIKTEWIMKGWHYFLADNNADLYGWKRDTTSTH